jgi:hypothetical protein
MRGSLIVLGRIQDTIVKYEDSRALVLLQSALSWFWRVSIAVWSENGWGLDSSLSAGSLHIFRGKRGHPHEWLTGCNEDWQPRFCSSIITYKSLATAPM